MPTSPSQPDRRPLWTVDRQEVDRTYLPSGQTDDERVIYFTTRSGVQDSVRVLASDYNAEKVATAIQALAVEIERVATLQGPMG